MMKTSVRIGALKSTMPNYMANRRGANVNNPL